MFYFDKKIYYIDYYENGNRISNAGFISLTFKDEDCNVHVGIRNLPSVENRMCRWFGLINSEQVFLEEFRVEKGEADFVSSYKRNSLGRTEVDFSALEGFYFALGKRKWGSCFFRNARQRMEPTFLEKPVKQTVLSAAAREEKMKQKNQAVEDSFVDSGADDNTEEEPHLHTSADSANRSRYETADSTIRSRYETADSTNQDRYETDGTDSLKQEQTDSDNNVNPEDGYDGVLNGNSESDSYLRKSNTNRESGSYSGDYNGDKANSAYNGNLNDNTEDDSYSRNPNGDTENDLYTNGDSKENQYDRGFGDTLKDDMDTRREYRNNEDPGSGTDSPVHKSVHRTTWEELTETHQLVHPFEDQGDYISINPFTLKLLAPEYRKLANNSFLLHGFYNYRHLILGYYQDEERQGYYIGVPGTFDEREQMVAEMFGFEGYEPAGGVGYYMRKVEF